MERRWRVVLLRNEGEIVGQVEATEVASAKAAPTSSSIWTKSSATESWRKNSAEVIRRGTTAVVPK
jgi:hypothetical protein